MKSENKYITFIDYISTTFNKKYVIDTNIILNGVENLDIISQNGNNLIIIPEAVLDELDSKKSGLNEINYQAREFGRLFEQAEILNIYNNLQDITIVYSCIESKNIHILTVAKDHYNFENNSNLQLNVLMDRKIIEVAKYVDDIIIKKDVIFLSNDIMARHRALSIGLKSESLKIYSDDDIELYKELEMSNIQSIYDFEYLKENYKIQDTITALKISDKNGKPFYYYKSGNIFTQIDENFIKRQEISPINMSQKIFVSQILDEYYNVVITNSMSGSGKTLIALSSAMKLLDLHKDKYDKIVYIRKTVLSDTEELGFLKGNLEEKMSGFLAPLYSNIEYIVEKKYKSKKKLTKNEIEIKMNELIEKYQIQFKYEGHLRGSNIRNAVVIWDEVQNDTINSAKTILTRISENCKVIILGSIKQIDNKFVNKYNNALTFLENKIGKNNNNVNVTGFNLTKVVRSAIAEWADDFELRKF